MNFYPCQIVKSNLPSFFIIFHPDSDLFRLMLPRRLLQKAAVPIRSSLSSRAVDSTGTKQTCRYVQIVQTMQVRNYDYVTVNESISAQCRPDI